MPIERPSRRVRLGIIGTGLAIKKLHWPALRQMSDRYEIVAFANDSAAGAEWFAEAANLGMDRYFADYHELLRRDDVEAVLIALPIPLLFPAARAALDAGKHVICEKPTGTTLEEGKAYVAMASDFPDQKILVAENFFYRDDVRLVRSLLEAGAIGPLHLMAWSFVSQLVPREGQFSSTPWRQVPEYRGGPQLDAGVHHIAQIRFLCGDVQSLHALLQYANPTTGGPSDLTLNLHFKSGAIGSYVGGHLPIPTPGESRDMRLYGAEGVLSVGFREIHRFSPNGQVEEYKVDADGGYYNELLNFYEAIVFGEPIVGTVAESYRNMAIVMRALDSAEQGRAIEIGSLPGETGEGMIPLWRPRGADGLFDGLPCRIVRTDSR